MAGGRPVGGRSPHEVEVHWIGPELIPSRLEL